MSKSASNAFSAKDRNQHLAQLKSETYDILVIGGGATGCGIALDAAARGMRVALVEKGDFASGTSSKSTKLIHGGLRYLKQFEVGLVRETGTERAIVHKLAPHLVIPEKMLLPIIKNGTFGKWAASIGVWVYDLVAGVEKEDRRKMLSKSDSLNKEPLLDESSLLGSCFYAEYRTDDARLTIELIKRAAQHGAQAINYCSATDFIYENNKVQGITALDHLTGDTFEVKARQVVSAGGPWVDKLRKINNSINHKQLHLTKGVHIVFPHEKFALKHSIYFDVPDGRMIFAIPRGKITYVGTTDTNYKGNLNRVVCTKADAKYLIDAIHHAFPEISLTEKDIISNWAGLRPLIHEDGKSPSELSRKDEIFESDTSLISIAGGKLTGYRKMAQRIVDLVDKRLPEKYGACTTKRINLVEDSLKNTKAVNQYIDEVHVRLSKVGFDRYYSWYLVTTYGKQTEKIIEAMQRFSDKPEIALARAEARFGVLNEMTNTLVDFFVRQTGRLYFDIGSIPLVRAEVAADMAGHLSWSDERKATEEKQLDLMLQDATTYYDAEFL